MPRTVFPTQNMASVVKFIFLVCPFVSFSYSQLSEVATIDLFQYPMRFNYYDN